MKETQVQKNVVFALWYPLFYSVACRQVIFCVCKKYFFEGTCRVGSTRNVGFSTFFPQNKNWLDPFSAWKCDDDDDDQVWSYGGVARCSVATRWEYTHTQAQCITRKKITTVTSTTHGIAPAVVCAPSWYIHPYVKYVVRVLPSKTSQVERVWMSVLHAYHQIPTCASLKKIYLCPHKIYASFFGVSFPAFFFSDVLKNIPSYVPAAAEKRKVNSGKFPFIILILPISQQHWWDYAHNIFVIRFFLSYLKNIFEHSSAHKTTSEMLEARKIHGHTILLLVFSWWRSGETFIPGAI